MVSTAVTKKIETILSISASDSPDEASIRVRRPRVPLDDEVGRVVEFLRAQAEPDYIDCLAAPESDEDGVADEDIDELFDDAMRLVVQAGKASTSMIQRHLRIGYNRAARIIEAMEREGIIGPADGAKPREVLVRNYDDLG